MRFKNIIKALLKWGRVLILTMGIIFITMVAISFTTLPFWGYYWLGSSRAQVVRPSHIVLLGGAGLPGRENLMRCWYTAQLANRFPQAGVIVALPGDTLSTSSVIYRLAEELLLRGVSKERIAYATQGHNTRGQALDIAQRIIDKEKSVMLVTSPTHMRRAVMCFERCGFTKVGGLPAFESGVDFDLSLINDKLGGTEWMPELGQGSSVRYQCWNHMQYEIAIIREMVALSYYQLKGWI